MAAKRKRDIFSSSSSSSSLDQNNNSFDVEASETEDNNSQMKAEVEDDDSQVTIPDDSEITTQPTIKRARIISTSSRHSQQDVCTIKAKKKSKIQKREKKVIKKKRFKFHKSKFVLDPSIPETPEQESLRNTLVLDQVMKRLHVNDLKNCRLVNKSWLASASRELRKYPGTAVRLKYGQGFGKEFYWSPKLKRGKVFDPPSPKKWSLRALNELMENCQHLPCTDFSFSEGKLKDPQVQLFFSRIGPEVKSLTLADSNSSSRSSSLFQQLLTIKAPNIERLTIQSGYSHSWKKHDDLFLPALKYFKVGHLTKPNQTTEKILQSAVNLEEFDGFTRHHIQVLTKTNKIHLVKKLKLDLCCPWVWKTENLVELADARPQIVDLEFVVAEPGSRLSTQDKQKRVEIMMRVLESSKNSLQKFKLRRLLFKEDTVFPRLENLKTLILQDPTTQRRRARWHPQNQNQNNDDNNSRFLPLGIDVQRTFPALETLILGQITDWTLRLPRVEDIVGRFLSVKTIEILNEEGKSWLSKLQDLCPKYTKLKLPSISDLDTFLPRVFSSCKEHLEHLEILLDCCGSNYPNFDPIFTGFSKVHCQLLLAKLSEEGRVPKYEKMRDLCTPWIGDLCKLKSLKIYFSICGHSWIKHPSSAPQHIVLSAVSHLYAFDLMKNKDKLEVKIGYDHQSKNGPMMTEILDSVQPFVNIVNYHHATAKEETD